MLCNSYGTPFHHDKDKLKIYFLRRFGNRKSVSIAGKAAVSHDYEAKNGNLLKSTYANGWEVAYTYDNLDRVTEVKASKDGTSYYRFPVRVPIYFKETKYIKTSSKDLVSAVFFGPNDLMVEPYIKIAVGDYNDLCKVQGKDDALAAILCSITHELTHYFQWIKYHELWLSGEKNQYFERQAVYYGRQIVYDYADTREHP